MDKGGGKKGREEKPENRSISLCLFSLSLSFSPLHLLISLSSHVFNLCIVGNGEGGDLKSLRQGNATRTGFLK